MAASVPLHAIIPCFYISEQSELRKVCRKWRNRIGQEDPLLQHVTVKEILSLFPLLSVLEKICLLDVRADGTVYQWEHNPYQPQLGLKDDYIGKVSLLATPMTLPYEGSKVVDTTLCQFIHQRDQIMLPGNSKSLELVLAKRYPVLQRKNLNLYLSAYRKYHYSPYLRSFVTGDVSYPLDELLRLVEQFINPNDKILHLVLKKKLNNGELNILEIDRRLRHLY
jgi:hypothetical protein